MHAFSRTELLIGKESLNILNQSRVAVFGIGGVGTFAVEGLARSGVGRFLLIDDDAICLTNINRQLHATRKTIGRSKVEVMRERILDINPKADVAVMKRFYMTSDDPASRHEAPDDEQCEMVPVREGKVPAPEIPAEQRLTWADILAYHHSEGNRLDYIIDAIDTVTAKLDLIENSKKAGIPVISCMGAGNKLDPTRLEVADIFATSVCPLARVVRKELRKRGVPDLKVVYSKEEPVTPFADESNSCSAHCVCPKGTTRTCTIRHSIPGSVSFVPSVAGLIIAGEVVKDLIHYQR